MSDGDGWNGRHKRVARFEPKRLDNLRACMRPYIGQVFHFTYAGHSSGDEEFPGQSRWMIERAEDELRLSDEAQGRWFPSEDLVDVEETSK